MSTVEDPMSGAPESAAQSQRSTLHTRHVEAGARFADFAGWSMPVQYAGTLAEHQAVRSAVGIFDVSHLGTLEVRGSGAAEHVNACLTNDIGRIAPGRAQYTVACDDASGGIVDDLIVYLRADDNVLLVPNAANCAEVARRLSLRAPTGVEVRNVHEDFAILAVQGPRSDEPLEGIGLPVGHPYMSFVGADTRWGRVTVCRSGYTGERGYELILDAGSAPELWDALFAAGESAGIVPCGLGARDTLRTEMGYPLHGQDISMDVTPNEAGLGWAVGWSKDAFWGRDALVAEKTAKPSRLLRGLTTTGRAIPRRGMSVRTAGESGDAVGQVTSGTFSPTLKVGIGLALLDRSVGLDDTVVVDVRGKPQEFLVTKPPFVAPSI